MALYPNTFKSKQKLQPGARGENFKVNMPGYRDDENRINRTQIRLNTNEHDTPNIKYLFDGRLPALFKYGFAKGYNQIVIPKGRMVAVDPYLDLVDYDTKKKHNTLTLANGGAPTRVRKDSDLYKDYKNAAEKMVSIEAQKKKVANVGIELIPIVGMEKAYSELCYRPFKGEKDKDGTVCSCIGPVAQLTAENCEIDVNTGMVIKKDDKSLAGIIPGNKPAGMLIRNEYTRDENAFNGMAPGAFNTDCMAELPWFAYKDKAEGNPWGSAYGGLFPGALVKSDENGRIVVSPLSFEQEVATMSLAEYELERQQVIGQVYSVSKELVPEGAARWATWALTDILNFEEFNPDVYRSSNRRGEDTIEHSPYASTGKYPGYPYEKTYGEHDLHMLASTRKNYNQRMNMEYNYQNLGIPGLTDGYNAVKVSHDPVQVGTIRIPKNIKEGMDLYFRVPEVHVENIQVALGDAGDFASLTEGGLLTIKHTKDKKAENTIEVKYADELQGMFVLKVKDITKAKTFASEAAKDKEDFVEVPVFAKFDKRGLAGVPTFMDWDGCIGSVKVLLQK